MSDVVDIQAKDGTVVLKYKMYDGMYMSLRARDVEERFRTLKTLKYKEGDVLIISYPKTGTHWLMDSIAMLMRGKAEVVPQTADGFLDLLADLNLLAQKDGPRIMETHLYPRHLSEDFLSKGKFILSLRNPKDTAVSYFYHVQQDSISYCSGSWDDYIECYAKGQVIPGQFFDYYRQWQEFMKSHRDQFLVVYYEDMHKDNQKQLRRIADFYGYDLTDETIAAISKKGDMKTVVKDLMKSPTMQEYAKTLCSDGSLPFYRKGIVGDWKNHFTVAQNEMFDALIQKEMKTLDFKFEYTL